MSGACPVNVRFHVSAEGCAAVKRGRSSRGQEGGDGDDEDDEEPMGPISPSARRNHEPAPDGPLRSGRQELPQPWERSCWAWKQQMVC